MGYLSEPSWSLSRLKALRNCPRAAWFTYYVKGEPDYASRAYALGDLTSLPMAAGAAVDHVIATCLKAFRDKGEVRSGLADLGVELLKKQLEISLKIVPKLKRGEQWKREFDSQILPFQHHYYEFDLGEDYLNLLIERVASCLTSFEVGEHWAFLRESDPQTWHPLSRLDGGEIPSFQASIGLKVWSSIDFAMRNADTVTVLDWKTGNRTHDALEEADFQLGIYSIWACKHYKVKPHQVQAQAVWLQSNSPLAQKTFSEAKLKLVAKRIKAGAEEEERRLHITENRVGARVSIFAPIENFEPRPQLNRCIHCRFREICDEKAIEQTSK